MVIEQGLEQERRSAIESLMTLRYRTIDDSLQNLIPRLLNLSSPDDTALLLQSSKSELIAHFAPSH